MKRLMDKQHLAKQNRDHAGTGGRSQENAGLGFAPAFLDYSTWEGLHGIYLEDLFVRPEFRGHLGSHRQTQHREHVLEAVRGRAGGEELG